MKLLLFILGLTCHSIVSAQTGGYTLVTPQEYHANPNISSFLQIGVNDFTGDEVVVGNLPAATYTAQTIYTIESQVVNNGINYRYNLTISNDLDWLLKAKFVVYNQPVANATQLVSYAYEVLSRPQSDPGTFIGEEEMIISEEEMNWEGSSGEIELSSDSSARLLQIGLPGGWNVVPLYEAQSDLDLQTALEFGVKQVTQMGIQNGQLANERYSDRLLSAEEQVVDGINYRFVVALNGRSGSKARATLEVYSQPWSGTEWLISYMIM